MSGPSGRERAIARRGIEALGTAQPRAVPVGTEVAKMSIHEKLRKQGYESDHEFGCPEDRTEVLVNREIGRGVAIEWFWLPEVGP